MKRIATALGICAFMLALPAADAAVAYTWDGSSSTNWATALNWTPGTGYPGQPFSSNDTATIADGSNQDTVIVSSAIPANVDWVKVDAETSGSGAADYDMTLKIDTSADLDVLDGSNTGYIQLDAGTHVDDSTTYADDAELWHAAGNLEVDIIDADGGTMDTTFGDRGKAVLDFDVSSGSGSGLEINVGVECSGDVLIEVANGVIVDLGAVTLESGSHLRITGAGTAEVELDSITSGEAVEFVGPLVVEEYDPA